MPKKTNKKTRDIIPDDFDPPPIDSPEKKKSRQDASEDDFEFDFLQASHPQNDFLGLSGHNQDPIGMSDEDWEETLTLESIK